MNRKLLYKIFKGIRTLALDSSTLLSGIQSLAAQPHTHLSIKEPPILDFWAHRFYSYNFPLFSIFIIGLWSFLFFSYF